jgi:NADPH:quinone reductase-like Zn-dependent oxidoreductase
MKAIVQDRYGSPDVLRLEDVDEPTAGANDVLVRVRAASVNAADWHTVRGDPYLARLSFGLRRPRVRIRGRDIAGVVEAVGAEVTHVRPGDHVYADLGSADGAFAEYAVAPAHLVDTMPTGLEFEEAAALPLAGGTALQGIRDVGGVQPGHQVLVNGSSGGVGTFAVQIAVALGAEVTAVCKTENAELARSLGAARVVDYTREDLTQTGRRYDVVLDLVGNRSLAELRGLLAPEGSVVLSGGGISEGGSLVGPMGLFLRATAAKPFVRDRLLTLDTKSGRPTLQGLRELVESGQVRPVIERTYALPEVPAAIRRLEVEHARAKIAITV